MDVFHPIIRRSETSEAWEQKFTDDLILKIHSQINTESDGNGADALVNSARLAVHFGHFYLLHAQEALQGSVESVSLNTVTESLEAIKSRPRFDRPEYDQTSIPDGFDIASRTPHTFTGVIDGTGSGAGNTSSPGNVADNSYGGRP